MGSIVPQALSLSLLPSLSLLLPLPPPPPRQNESCYAQLVVAWLCVCSAVFPCLRPSPLTLAVPLQSGTAGRVWSLLAGAGTVALSSHMDTRQPKKGQGPTGLFIGTEALPGPCTTNVRRLPLASIRTHPPGEESHWPQFPSLAHDGTWGSRPLPVSERVSTTGVKGG